jgi:methyl-accepting chemotaxis protein/tetratricopeptide (TPR) repeat protein
MANSYNQELIQALRIFNRGDYHEARRKFTQLALVKDKDPQIRLWLGAACLEVGYFEDARSHWQTALTLTSDPNVIQLIHTSLSQLEQAERERAAAPAPSFPETQVPHQDPTGDAENPFADLVDEEFEHRDFASEGFVSEDFVSEGLGDEGLGDEGLGATPEPESGLESEPELIFEPMPGSPSATVPQAPVLNLADEPTRDLNLDFNTLEVSETSPDASPFTAQSRSEEFASELFDSEVFEPENLENLESEEAFDIANAEFEEFVSENLAAMSFDDFEDFEQDIPAAEDLPKANGKVTLADDIADDRVEAVPESDLSSLLPTLEPQPAEAEDFAAVANPYDFTSPAEISDTPTPQPSFPEPQRQLPRKSARLRQGVLPPPPRRKRSTWLRSALLGIGISLFSVGLTGGTAYMIMQEALQRQVVQVQQGQVINPLEESNYLSRRLLLGLLVAATGSALISVVMILLSSKQTQRGLSHAIEATQRIALGDFKTRVLVQGEDQVAQLGANLNQMASSLQSLFDQLSHLQALDRDRAAPETLTQTSAQTPTHPIVSKVEVKAPAPLDRPLEEPLRTSAALQPALQPETSNLDDFFAQDLVTSSLSDAISALQLSQPLPGAEVEAEAELTPIEQLDQLDLRETPEQRQASEPLETLPLETSSAELPAAEFDPFKSVFAEMEQDIADIKVPPLPTHLTSPKASRTPPTRLVFNDLVPNDQENLTPAALEPEVLAPEALEPEVLEVTAQQSQPVTPDMTVLQTALDQLQLIHESVTHLSLQAKQKQQQTELARQLLANGDATIARTAAGFESLQTAVHAVKKRLAGLTVLSQQGSSMIDIIHQFAERTSQLAMNTAIASERSSLAISQNGFSNLSGQVRCLAADAELITEEVSLLVQALQADLPQVDNVLTAETQRLQDNWQQVQNSRAELHQIIENLNPVGNSSTLGWQISDRTTDEANPTTTDPVLKLTLMVEDLQARVDELQSNLVSVGAKA